MAGRRQEFRWVNGIEYEYYSGKRKRRQELNVVICEESWEEIDAKNCREITKSARHSWISSNAIQRKNIHERCNLTARKRWLWLQENNILKEKHQGYQYKHIFSHDWNAMKGYHYLMHIARMLNEMALHSIYLIENVKEAGIREFIKDFRETMIRNDLDTERIRRLMESPGQLRLVEEDDWKTKRTAA